jgi:hypothetical protein
MPDLACFNCDRMIAIDQPFSQADGVTVATGTLVKHTTCPPGRCASCGAERPYVELDQVPEMDDPDMLACSNVYACQVRAGEIDADDVPRAALG